MQPTSDPTVFIEEQRPGYVRYRRTDGRRWIVRGECNYRGDCLLGSVITVDGKLVAIDSHRDIEILKKRLGKERIDSELDVPVTPEFKTCCGSDIFEYEELEPVEAF